MSKHPIFIIEGPDGVGKTTLSDKLCALLGAEYIHLTYRFKDRMHLYHGAALRRALRIAEKRPVVIDRWWPSETVYAEAYRGGTKWPLLHRHLERVALRHGVTYVFCLPEDRGRYLEHFNVLKGQRTEMYDSGMDRVYDGFVKVHDRLVAESRPAVVRYDMFKEGHQLDQVIQNILETSADYRALTPDFLQATWPRAFSGSFSQGKYLVVQDRPAAEREKARSGLVHHEPYPFVGTYGVRLSRVLDLLQVPESQMAYAYLGTQSGNTAISLCARHMRVIAMGQDVANRLTVPVYTVVSPFEEWGDNMENDVVQFYGVFDAERN